MNSLRRITLFLLCVGPSYTMVGLGPLFTAFDAKKWDAQQSFDETVDKNIEQLLKRKQEASDAHEGYKSSLEAAQKSLAALKEDRQRVEGVELEYASEQVVILTSTVQVLGDLVRVYKQINDIIDEHVRMLEEYKEDPEFEKKGYLLEEKSIYSVEDYQEVNNAIYQHKNELTDLQDRLAKLSSDAETLKKSLTLAKQDLTEKKQEQEELKDQEPEDRLGRSKFTLKQQGSLLDAEERLLTYKRDFIEARLLEGERKKEFFEFRVKVKKQQLDILQKQEELVRGELRIEQKDLEASEKAFREQAQRTNRLHEEYDRLRESLRLVKQDELEKIKSVKERVGISDEVLDDILSWTYKPPTVKGWTALIEIGRLHDHIQFEVDVRNNIYLAKMEQSNAQVAEKEVENLLIQTWQRFTTGQFDGTTDALSKEQKKYEKILAELEGSIASIEDKRTEASRLLSKNNQVAATIKERLGDFKNQRESTFKNDPVPYNRLGELLQNEAFVEAQKRSEYITQLIELFSTLMQQQEETIEKVDTVLNVLKSKSQLQLVPPLWNGVKKFIPDIGRFIRYMVAPGRLQASIGTIKTTFVNGLTPLQTDLGLVVLLLFYLFSALILYFFFRFYLHDIALLITTLIPPEYGFIHMVADFVSMILQFFAWHLTGIFLWATLLLSVKFGIQDSYLKALFHLISVPFWLVYVNRFIGYTKGVNRARDYQIVSEKYQGRFFGVLAVLLSSTIVLIFVGKAMSKVFPYSDVPRILQAVNFIIFQVSLILMLSREQLIRLIPSNTSLGKWVQEFVDRYYYLFLAGLIVIIVMSNPYIGYGTLFLYLILRIGLILLLIPLIIAVHNRMKSVIARLFFEYDEEGRLSERFTYARTSYGLLIIGSFVFFSIMALLIAANIWGLQFGFKEIVSWLRKDLWSYRSADTGRMVAVNALHLGRMLFYLIIGTGIAFLINKYVLRRMFDLLMVESGVQGIILSLTRYAIILGALIIGLQSIGLGQSFLLYILSIIVGLGVAGKEIIADILGYFIILIQRPIKIGDFIQVNPDLIGVIRHINLRSVVLRRKNSLTILVPNSMLLANPLVNWNYYRTYFAFDDIFITVSYSVDPQEIKELFLKILDDNYNVLRNPAPIVRLSDFTDSGFLFMVRGYLSHDKVIDQYDIASDVRLELIRVMRQHGYTLGVPGRQLLVVPESKKDEALEALGKLAD